MAGDVCFCPCAHFEQGGLDAWQRGGMGDDICFHDFPLG